MKLGMTFRFAHAIVTRMNSRPHRNAGWASACCFLILVIGPSAGWAKEPPSAEGYSAQIQIEPLLRSTKTASGAPMTYPSTDKPQVTALRVTIPPGASTGWHEHPFPCYAYILSGVLTVEFPKGEPQVLHPGEALVEVVNTPHNGINRGTEPVELVMFATGEVGKPITIRLPSPLASPQ